MVDHKLEEEFFDSIRGGVQRRRFILLIFPISQQFPRLTSLNFFSFPNDRWNLTAFFVDSSQVDLNN